MCDNKTWKWWNDSWICVVDWTRDEAVVFTRKVNYDLLNYSLGIYYKWRLHSSLLPLEILCLDVNSCSVLLLLEHMVFPLRILCSVTNGIGELPIKGKAYALVWIRKERKCKSRSVGARQGTFESDQEMSTVWKSISFKLNGIAALNVYDFHIRELWQPAFLFNMWFMISSWRKWKDLKGEVE